MEEQTNGRRNFLIGVSSLAALLVAKAASAGMGTLAAQPQVAPTAPSRNSLDRNILQGKAQIPEVTVETHEGKTVRLYADLVKDKVVTMNYMSIKNEAHFPICKNLLEVARRLGSRLGKEVHMISITSDPHNDTPERLQAFAEQLGAPNGWYFVRTTDRNSAIISTRLYRHGRRPDPHTRMDLVHYGNAGVGLWAAFPAMIQ
ncbi:MAG: SCO family protein, partial [Nitrospirota bacterium]